MYFPYIFSIRWAPSSFWIQSNALARSCALVETIRRRFSFEARFKAPSKVKLRERQWESLANALIWHVAFPLCCRYPGVLRADAARRVEIGAAENGGDDPHRRQMGSQRRANYADLRSKRREFCYKIYIYIYMLPIFHGGASFIIFREGILAAADRDERKGRKRIVEQTEDRQGEGGGRERGLYIRYAFIVAARIQPVLVESRFPELAIAVERLLEFHDAGALFICRVSIVHPKHRNAPRLVPERERQRERERERERSISSPSGQPSNLLVQTTSSKILKKPLCPWRRLICFV